MREVWKLAGLSSAFVASAFVAVALVAGTSMAEDTEPEVKVEVERAGRSAALTSAGSFYVEWWPEPEPLPLNEIFTIHFRVFEAEDRQTPIDDAVVTANAWMPDHNHGTSLQPRLESHGDGSATGQGFLLHMEGYWQLRVGVAVAGQMERATFDIHLEP